MRALLSAITFLLVFSVATGAGAVDIDFDLFDGTLNPNPPADVSPPDSYHSGQIPTGTLRIEPGQTAGIWITFEDMFHLEVIDDPPNSDGVERLVTHLQGRVVPDGTGGTAFTDLWVDVILTGVTGHIRETFKDPNDPHPTRPPLGNDPTNPDRRGGNSSNDDPTGDWDGAFDDSGTDLWDLFHETVPVDSESHVVIDGFILETWADDLTDARYLFHDIHWEITNHGDRAVEIFNVEFWQDGNVLKIGEWIPEPSSVMLIALGLASLGQIRRRQLS